MNKVLLVLLSILFAEVKAQRPEYAWSNAFGSQSIYTEADFMAVDKHGNVYTVGAFSGSTDFDDGPGTAVLSNSAQAHYIRKTDSTGAFLWVKKFGGNTTASIRSIAVDSQGNLFLSGSAEGGIDLDPGQGSLVLNTPNNNFIIKVNGNGDLSWTRIDSTKFSTTYQSIYLDGNDNLYASGYYMAGYDFDKGSGTYTLTAPPQGEKYVFVSKLSPAGNHLWSEVVCNQPQAFFLTSLCADKNGNTYLSGSFADPLEFDPGASNQQFTSAGNYDAFLCKVDSTGNFAWALRTGGSFDDQGSSVVCDLTGNVLLAGGFTGLVDFDPGAGVYTISATSSGFIQKLSSTGNLIWAKACPSWISSDQTDRRIAIDNMGNILISGYLVGNATVPSSTFAVSSQGDRDVIIAKYKPDGTVAWAGAFGGEFVDQPYAIATGPYGMIYVAGAFSSLYADLDPGNAVVPASTGTAITSAFVVVFEQPCADTVTLMTPHSDNHYCSGETYTIRGFGKGTLEWLWNGLFADTGAIYQTGILQPGTYTVSLRERQGHCSGGTGDSEVMVFESCIGLPEAEDQQTIAVIPNPFRDVVRVNSTFPLAQLIIYDASGREVFRRTDKQNRSAINFSDYPPGVYLITCLSADGKTFSERIVHE